MPESLIGVYKTVGGCLLSLVENYFLYFRGVIRIDLVIQVPFSTSIEVVMY